MATTAATTKATSAQSGELVCPECGKSFTRAQALGAHRRQAHGVAGTSKNAKAQKSATPAAPPRRGRPSGRNATPAAGRTQTRSRGSSNGSGQSVNRDALLRTLFPSGIPPQHDLMVAVNAWLDEAERLVRRR